MAEWENKTGKAIENRIYNEQKRNFDNQVEKFVDIRRKKLSDLLNNEERTYHMELIANQDTPEAARRRMEEELRKLKSQRLADKDNTVKKLMEKKFYDGADELRKNDSEAFAFECYLEQENQMLDKLKRREKQRKEEEFYVKLNEFDNLKKIEKEKADEIVKRQKMKNIFDYQKWQRQQNEQALKHMNDIKQLENKRIKEQWKRDDEAEERNKQQRLMDNIQVYKDIEEFNRQEEAERKKKADFEKMKDKELIDSIVNKEKALDEIDKQEKLRKIQEFHQNKKYLQYVMAQKKEAELWMDKIAQDEADKAYNKEKEAWLKEEAKRIELLKDVYKSREQAVRYNKQLQEDEKAALKQEREIVDNEIKEYNEKVIADNLAELNKRKVHQNELKMQIGDKEILRQKEHQDELYERRAAKLWEIEYQKKIDEQRALHLQRLREIKNRNNAENI